MQKEHEWVTFLVAVTMVLLFATMISCIVRRPAETTFQRCVDVLMLLISLCALAPAAGLSLYMGVRLWE